MDGLLLKLLPDGFPGLWFWRLFGPIRQDLDRLYWCFPFQPWMGAPEKFYEDDSVIAAFDNQHGPNVKSSVMLWQPGSLGRYADEFGEEFVELWGIEPTVDDPRQVAFQYDSPAGGDAIARRYARVWLLYTDSTAWEIYARKPRLLEAVREHVRGKPWIEEYESHVDRRAAAFGAAGLSRVWLAAYGSRHSEPDDSPGDRNG